MPIVLMRVSQSDFKDLEKKRGGSYSGKYLQCLVRNGNFYLRVFHYSAFVVASGCQILIPLFLTAWLNRKVFLYDVLQDFASKEERQLIQKKHSEALYGMGLLLGFVSYIPLAFFSLCQCFSTFLHVLRS